MCALFKIYLQPWKKVILRSFLKLVIFSNFLKIMVTTQAKTNENFVCVIASFLRPWSHLCYRFRNAPSFFSYCLSMSQTEKDFLFFSKLMALYMCFATHCSQLSLQYSILYEHHNWKLYNIITFHSRTYGHYLQAIDFIE